MPNINFPLKPYENFIFDFAGVLFECDYVKFVRKAFPHAKNYTELADKIFKSEIWSQYDINVIDQEELTIQLCNLVPCQTKDIDRLIEAIKEHMVPMPDSIKLLYDLKNKNVKLYGLTNMPKDIYDHLIKSYEFLKLFDDITCSSYIHLAKPESKIYQYLINKNKIDMSKSIFTDDRSINLIEPKKLGIKTILFTNPNQFIQDLQHTVDVKFAPQTTANIISVTENRP